MTFHSLVSHAFVPLSLIDCAASLLHRQVKTIPFVLSLARHTSFTVNTLACATPPVVGHHQSPPPPSLPLCRLPLVPQPHQHPPLLRQPQSFIHHPLPHLPHDHLLHHNLHPRLRFLLFQRQVPCNVHALLQRLFLHPIVAATVSTVLTRISNLPHSLQLSTTPQSPWHRRAVFLFHTLSSCCAALQPKPRTHTCSCHFSLPPSTCLIAVSSTSACLLARSLATYQLDRRFCWNRCCCWHFCCCLYLGR